MMCVWKNACWTLHAMGLWTRAVVPERSRRSDSWLRDGIGRFGTGRGTADMFGVEMVWKLDGVTLEAGGYCDLI